MSKRRKKRTNQVPALTSASVSEEKCNFPTKIELDYDKLAEAIVRANKMHNNNQFKHSKRRLKIMNFCNGIIYMSGYAYCITKIINLWTANSHVLRDKVLLTAVFLIMALILFVMQQESLDETEEETVFHFNSNVAFYALIVALIELLK